MTPLADAPRELLRSRVGVVFDVDDTLTTHGRLTSDAYAALSRLHEAGLKLVAVTGRPLGWCDVMAAMWPVDVAIGENGAGWVFRERGALSRGTFEPEPAMRAHAQHLSEIERAVRARLPELVVSSDHLTRRFDLAFDVHEREDVSAQKLAELVAVIEAHGARAVVSSVHAHAAVGTWDKARGAARAIREVLDADAREFVFVGDSGNDDAAFGFFPCSVGVANIDDHLARLTHRPRFRTEEARGRGFVELAERLLEARGA